MKNIIINNSDRFKSVFVTVNFLLPLSGDMASKNALLAMVLRKCNNKYKTERELERKLSSLYDASLDLNIEKIGGRYNISFSIEFLGADYIKKEEIQEVIDVLYFTICEPKRENGNLDIDMFNREKLSLIEKIEEEKDNKKKYALKKLEQEMFKETEYGTSVFGTIEQVKEITLKDLTHHYDYVINNAKIIVTVSGNTNGLSKIGEEVYNKICKKCGTQEIAKKADGVIISKREVITTIEKQEINQSVLCIGAQIERLSKEDVYIAMVYDAILGGTPASKLFQNVREKESLAYFAKSAFNRHTGTIYMYSGIAPSKYEKARAVMIEQIEMLKQGKLTEEEFYAAKENLISSYRELQDSKEAIAKMMLGNELFFDKQFEVSDIIARIDNVTIEQVKEIANRVIVKNVFLLGGVVGE